MVLRSSTSLRIGLALIPLFAACDRAAPSSACAIDDGPALNVAGRADGVYGVVDDAVGESPLVQISNLRLTATGVDSESGKPWLSVSAPAEVSRPLVEFTAAPEGKSVAVVLGGEVASRHKVRVQLTSGNFQISCCDPRVCDRWISLLGGAPANGSASPGAAVPR